MKLFRSIVQACVLGVMLLVLWSCGNATTPEVEALMPSDQWQTLQTSTVQLEIPPGYVGGEPGRQLTALQATLTAWGFGDRNEWLAQNADKIDLLALQHQAGDLNSINVVQESRPADLTVTAYLQQQQAKLQAAGISSNRESTPQGDGLTIQTEQGTQHLYIYPTDETFWVITYSSTARNPRVTAQIQRSQQSFQVLPEPT